MPDLNWSKDGPHWPHHSASEFVEAAGIRWHVQRMGQGTPLVLVHGTGASAHSWRDLAPRLAEHFTVVAMDLPGHGFTQSPHAHRLSLPAMSADVSQLLRVLGIAPQVVVGHSAGAAILARMCLDGRIAPRLLVSLNGAFLPFGGIAGHMFAPLAKLLAMNPLVPRLFAWQVSGPGAVDRLIRGTGSVIDARGIALYGKLVSSPKHVAAALGMMANWQLEPLLCDLPHLKTKLVLVTADKDKSVSPEVGRRVQQSMPQAELETLHGLGHLAHEERPEIVATLILRASRKQTVPMKRAAGCKSDFTQMD